MATRLGWTRLWLICAAILPFCGSLASGFHFDDYGMLQDAAIRAPGGWLTLWNLRQTRPLTYFTFWLNYRLGGENPLGYHALNLVLHAAAVLLLYEMLQVAAKREALFASLIFAVHPIQAEAVDYVWARSIVLAAIFAFAAWRDWNAGREWRAVFFFGLALLAKEECAALPLALLLFMRRPDFARQIQSRLAALAAMCVFSLVAAAHVLYALSVTPGAVAGAQAGISPWKYFLTQGKVIWRYFRLTLFPFGFTIDPQIHVPDVFDGIVAWLVLAILAACLWRYARWFAAGLALLLPTSSFFPAEDLAADRRMYLALAAFAVVLVQAGRRIRCPKRLGALLVLALAAVSVARTYVWMSDERLWREAAELAPGKVRPKIQLARDLPAEEALGVLADARRLAPNNPNVATETGKVLLAEGNAAAALGEFGRALALDPRDARNYNNRGAALLALGQRDAAREDFRRALKLDPSLTAARRNLEAAGW